MNNKYKSNENYCIKEGEVQLDPEVPALEVPEVSITPEELAESVEVTTVPSPPDDPTATEPTAIDPVEAAGEQPTMVFTATSDSSSPPPPPRTRPRIGVKSIRGRAPVVINAAEVRERAQVDLEAKILDTNWTNIDHVFEEVDYLNSQIRAVGNVKGDIVRSGLRLTVILRVAAEQWSETISKYKAEVHRERFVKEKLEEELRDAQRDEWNNSARDLLIRCKALEAEVLKERSERSALEKKLQSAQQATPMEVDHGQLLAELRSLKEQNALLNAEVAALAGNVAEHGTGPTEAELLREVELEKLRLENETLIAKVKSHEQATAKTSKSNTKRKKKTKKLNQGAEIAIPTAPAGNDEGEDGRADGAPGFGNGSGDGDDGFTLVPSKRKRKSKARTKGEAIVIKANEAKYSEILREMRTNSKLSGLGEDVRTVRRTRRKELLLVLKKGAKESSGGYSKLLADEGIGATDGTTIKALGSEVTLQCKNLDETTTIEDLCRCIKSSCNIGDVMTNVVMRKFARGTKKATFKLPAEIANMVLKVGKIKVNWSICPVSLVIRPEVCFKCLEFGHKSWNCKGPDRTKLCRRCGGEGHKAAGCKATAKCLICKGDGNKHVTGSFACPSYASAMEKLRPCK